MIRLFIEQKLSTNKEIVITGKDHHYLCNVMRSRVGDFIILINGKDGEWKGEIFKISKREVVLNIVEKVKDFYKPPFLGLVFVPTQKIDLLVKNATELGTTEFQPIYSEYMYKSKLKLEKAKANIKEAVEQCERTDFPDIKNILKLEEFLSNLDKNDIVLFCEERTGENDAFNVFMDLRRIF
jgi:16S rRNA (uracil1498-N3)-methyltransferase